MTIATDVRQKVIELHKNGKKRHEIVYDLNTSGISISTGSVSNVISEWRQGEGKGKLEQQQSSSQSPPNVHTNNTSSPVPETGKVITTNTNSRLSTFPEETAAEKEFKDNKDFEIKNHEITQTHAQNWDNNGQSDLGRKGSQGPLSWLGAYSVNGQDYNSEIESKTLQSETSVLSDSPNSTFVKEQPRQQQKELIMNIEDVLEPDDKVELESEAVEPIQKPVTESNPKKIYPRDPMEDRFDIERRAWDYYGFAWTKIQNRIDLEKQQRHHEFLLIDRRKQKLQEAITEYEQRESNLSDRENRVIEAEPYLPVARQLQDMKLVLEDTLPWIEAMKEAAQTQNLNFREAALYIAQELQLNRQFGGIQRQIEQAQGELKMLNITRGQKQEVITTLLKLQQNGVKDDDIIGLSKMIDLNRMGREWTGPKTGLGQGNNGSNNPGSPSPQPNGSPSPQPGDNFSIWLNLLKSASSRA